VAEATGARMSAKEAATHYLINPGLSRFTARVFASGMLSSFGHNPTIAIRGYTGEAVFPLGNLEQASLRISIPADSLDVADDLSQKDRAEIETRMKQEVLETSIYPEIVFESSQVTPNGFGENLYAVQVTGNLTLHGVMRTETISGQVALTGDTLRAFGEFSIQQTNYGIKLVSVAAGGLKVKDEVKCAFDFSARQSQ
jgi:polyisoprenoid-binding protein YceI